MTAPIPSLDLGGPDAKGALSALPETPEESGPEPAAEPEKKKRGWPKGRARGHGSKRTKADLERELEELRAKLPPEEGGDAVTPEQIERARKYLVKFFAGLGGLLALRADYWRFSQEECELLADTWAELLAPWLQKGGDWFKWAWAIVVSYGIVEPKIKQEQQARKLFGPDPLEGKEEIVVDQKPESEDV